MTTNQNYNQHKSVKGKVKGIIQKTRIKNKLIVVTKDKMLEN